MSEFQTLSRAIDTDRGGGTATNSFTLLLLLRSLRLDLPLHGDAVEAL